MEVVITVGIFLIVLMTALQIIGGIISFLWQASPTILFIAAALWYGYHYELDERKNSVDAEYSGLLENQSRSSQQTSQWSNYKILPPSSSRSQSKQD